jgi:hypothetical protein
VKATLEPAAAEAGSELSAQPVPERQLRGSLRPVFLAIPGMVLAFLLILPFLNKAFAVDDPIYLLESAHAAHDFWHPLRFDLCWLAENVCAPAPKLIPNVALIAWFFLPASWFGNPEWLIHLMQIGVLCLGIIATVSIAMRLGCTRVQSVLAGLVIASFPVVLAYTNGATPDTLAMALGAAGMDRLLAWKDERTLASGLAGGVLLGLAPLARPHLLLLIPLAMLSVAAGSTPATGRLIRAIWPLATSALVFVCGFLLARDGGGSVSIVPAGFVSAGNVAYNAFSYFWYLVIPFPLGIAWMIGAGRRGIGLLLASAGVFLALTRLGGAPRLVSFIVVCALCGLAPFVATVWSGLRERSWSLVMLALWSAIPLSVVSYVHLPPKYLMSGAPAIAILVVLFLRSCRFFIPCVSALIAFCVILSVLTLRADAEFAGKARTAVRDLITPERAAGRTVWFTGEWGLYWYAQQAGARVLMPTGPQPLTGDLLLVGAEGAASGLAERFPHRTLLARREYHSQCGTTMNHKTGAGLHSNVVGPFVWSPLDGYLDSYDLWRIA